MSGSAKPRKAPRKAAPETPQRPAPAFLDLSEAAAPAAGTGTEAALLERSRTYWEMGDWDSLAGLAGHPLDAHPDRAKLSLLAGIGLAQTGDMDAARRMIRRALDWGCPRDLVARVLVAGVHNSLGCLASLLQDEARATGHFEASVGIVNPRTDAAAIGRIRNMHQKARIGQLPAAAALMDAALAAAPLTARRGDIEMLKVQMYLFNGMLSQAIGRGQLTATPDRDPQADLKTRAASQLGQDLWVLEKTGYKRGGYFVEFGATDGVLLSNSLLLEREFGWQGLCAEPNPAFFEKLRQNRSCTVSDACIMGKSGQEIEFVLADEFGSAVAHIDRDDHGKNRRPFLDAGKVIRLTSISLDDFLTRHGAPREIDYLSIDTEGSEYEILSHLDWDKWHIRLVTVEHNYTEDRARIRDLMCGAGYEVVEAQWDDWYFRPESAGPGGA